MKISDPAIEKTASGQFLAPFQLLLFLDECTTLDEVLNTLDAIHNSMSLNNARPASVALVKAVLTVKQLLAKSYK